MSSPCNGTSGFFPFQRIFHVYRHFDALIGIGFSRRILAFRASAPAPSPSASDSACNTDMMDAHRNESAGAMEPRRSRKPFPPSARKSRRAEKFGYFFRRLGVIIFFKIEFGNRELAVGSRCALGRENAAPRQFTSDAHAVARILSYASRERQCFEQGLASLHLMCTPGVFTAPRTETGWLCTSETSTMTWG